MSEPKPRRIKREPSDFDPLEYRGRFDPDNPDRADENQYDKIRGREKEKRRKERSKVHWDERTIDRESLSEAIVTEVQPKGCFGHAVGGEEEPLWLTVRKVLRGKKQLTKKILAVGDRVLYQPAGDGEGVIEEVQERRTSLSRPATRGQDQIQHVLVANADQLAIVASIRMPEVRPGLIDRYWIAAKKTGMNTVIVLNKTDLDPGNEADRIADIYRPLGLAVVKTNAITGDGVSELRDIMKGKTTVLCGHSGVGKSTLLKALMPDLEIRIGEVPTRYSKGRHTTSSATMYRMTPDTHCIDTPGVREFGLWGVKPEDVEACYPEIAALAPQCQFNNCHHDKEKDCAVKTGVIEGSVHPHRLETYLRIKESLLTEY